MLFWTELNLYSADAIYVIFNCFVCFFGCRVSSITEKKKANCMKIVHTVCFCHHHHQHRMHAYLVCMCESQIFLQTQNALHITFLIARHRRFYANACMRRVCLCVVWNINMDSMFAKHHILNRNALMHIARYHHRLLSLSFVCSFLLRFWVDFSTASWITPFWNDIRHCNYYHYIYRKFSIPLTFFLLLLLILIPGACDFILIRHLTTCCKQSKW